MPVVTESDLKLIKHSDCRQQHSLNAMWWGAFTEHIPYWAWVKRILEQGIFRSITTVWLSKLTHFGDRTFFSSSMSVCFSGLVIKWMTL